MVRTVTPPTEEDEEDLDQIHEPGAVILSGGPKSTTDADAPDIDFEWLTVYQ